LVDRAILTAERLAKPPGTQAKTREVIGNSIR